MRKRRLSFGTSLSRTELLGRLSNVNAAGDFRWTKRVDGGGQGVVWAAREQHMLQREVAVKVFFDTSAPIYESRLAARVVSPHVTRVHYATEFLVAALPDELRREVENHDRRREGENQPVPTHVPALVMEYLTGGNLHRSLHAEPHPRDAAIRWVGELLQGLIDVHAHDVRHGDLKPKNLLLDRRGNLRIADFGAARHLSQTGGVSLTVHHQREHLIMTLAFSAPEQLDGASDTVAIDIYQMAATAFTLLTGKLPYPAATDDAVYRRIIGDAVADPRDHAADLSGPLAAWVMRGMAKEPEERWPSARAALRAWDRALAQTLQDDLAKTVSVRRPDIMRDSAPLGPNAPSLLSAELEAQLQVRDARIASLVTESAEAAATLALREEQVAALEADILAASARATELEAEAALERERHAATTAEREAQLNVLTAEREALTAQHTEAQDQQATHIAALTADAQKLRAEHDRRVTELEAEAVLERELHVAAIAERDAQLNVLNAETEALTAQHTEAQDQQATHIAALTADAQKLRAEHDRRVTELEAALAEAGESRARQHAATAELQARLVETLYERESGERQHRVTVDAMRVEIGNRQMLLAELEARLERAVSETQVASTTGLPLLHAEASGDREMTRDAKAVSERAAPSAGHEEFAAKLTGFVMKMPSEEVDLTLHAGRAHTPLVRISRERDGRLRIWSDLLQPSARVLSPKSKAQLGRLIAEAVAARWRIPGPPPVVQVGGVVINATWRQIGNGAEAPRRRRGGTVMLSRSDALWLFAADAATRTAAEEPGTSVLTVMDHETVLLTMSKAADGKLSVFDSHARTRDDVRIAGNREQLAQLAAELLQADEALKVDRLTVRVAPLGSTA